MVKYIDGTLACGNKHLQKLVDLIPEIFEPKPIQFIPFLFDGSNILKKNRQYFLEETSNGTVFMELSMDATFDEFRITMHKLAWLWNRSPEIVAGVDILSAVVLENYNPDDIKTINKLMQHVVPNLNDFLRFGNWILKLLR